MSEALNLLNSLEETSTVTEGLIVIDRDRRITVPTSLKRLAVQFDHNIETVTFECPRYWDGIDMSAMEIYINYIRADSKPGAFKAMNVTVTENSETMTFDWLIGGHVTEVNGNIAFNVCTKKVDAEGNIKNHWNSELCTDCYISKGLEFDSVMESAYPDITVTIAEQAAAIIDDSLSVMVGTGVVE